MSLYSINAEELATILAALRFYQAAGMGDPSSRSAEIHDIATDGDNLCSLDREGIDALCTRLNTPDDDEACNCDDSSWHGAEHQSACPFAGQPLGAV